MHTTAFWLTPLILLIGVALLIVSTSVRGTRLEAKLDAARHTAAAEPLSPGFTPLRIRQRLFRQAAVSLYMGLGTLAAAGVAGGWAANQPVPRVLPASVLTAAGIACLLFAVVQLIRETLLSVAQGDARPSADDAADDPVED